MMSDTEPLDRLSRYTRLTRSMYEVRRRCPRLPVLGVSALHPRHPLPADQFDVMAAVSVNGHQQRQGVADRPMAVPSWPTLIRSWLWCVLSACRYTVRIALLRLRCWHLLGRLVHEPATVVMKTWRFAASFSPDGPDFYYGTLPQQLLARGVSSVVVWGDQAPGHIDQTMKRTPVREQPLRAVSEHSLVPLWAPLLTACQQLAGALALRRLATRAKDPHLVAVSAAACVQSVSYTTLQNTLAFYIARTAVRRWRAQVFLTLYEGQPWETTARHGARAANPQCVTVGYQHTAILPHSLSLLSPNRDSWEFSAPDIVLCLGDIPRRMMAPGHAPHNSRLVPFGTFRKLPNSHDEHLQDPARRTVLVVPETGVIREATLLFNFAMRSAALLSDHRFIFRCHPVMPFERVRPHLDETPERFANIEISPYRAITDDFARSSVVLYRGSSSVLYAVLHGLKPIYLRDERYEHSDPLFELTDWRESVSSVSELDHVLKQYAAMSKEMAVVPWRRAAEYVRTYVVPVTEASVDRLLEATVATGGLPRA